MPKQETMFEHKTRDKSIEVLKVYERDYVRQAFENMDEPAQKHLWSSLGVNESYDAADLPPRHDIRLARSPVGRTAGRCTVAKVRANRFEDQN
jgi:hypothetical protein